jgi:hypothetical protein
VKMDPRIKAPLAELQKQFETASSVARRQTEINEARGDVTQLRSQISKIKANASGNAGLAPALDALDRKAEAIDGSPRSPDAAGNASEPREEGVSLAYLSGQFGQIASAVNSGDGAPTSEAMKALADAQTTLAATMTKWKTLKSKELPALNAQLKQAGIEPIVIGTVH